MAQKQGEHQISFGMAQPSSSSIHPNFMISKESNGAYDLGELDQALFLYLDAQEQRVAASGELMPETLNIFPSQPMHEEPSMKSSKSASDPQASSEIANDVKPLVKRKNITSSSDHEGPKTPDPKTLRRLAQNREAARKSRLRKKAYVQQLECSRIKLAQIEQELQRSRAQGLFFGAEGLIGEHGLHPGFGNLSSDPAMFDMEYARWLEEHHRRMCELRAAVDEHMQENELQIYVGHCLAHYDEVMNLKNIAIKTDVFHLLSGVWMAPAERCFMWLGGFRPSKIIKIIMSNLEPLTEQQLIQIYNLQQMAQENEEALSQGLESLQQSLSNTILSEALSFPSNMADYMDQMAMAMNKLSSLETFVKQADSLRQQTLHRLNQILTSRQMARCLLIIAEYFHRLRALSSLWLSRPRQE
ncbi:bZIP transcription factor TGA10-like isoform X2 [Dioscorea cayenensis subsp. rotundata]|uniref:BZIP transcription factor TGA10-like isoform X2 n=1 Tax=Dioscorea cayennensis subsp. rotundata TaxID=55577 RepID=A0AB40BT20_DIOCR|nr:bZIP transcription factor TGA10-like isoform X2 [Dioscorea cayenensis subsp. rotundata]